MLGKIFEIDAERYEKNLQRRSTETVIAKIYSKYGMFVILFFIIFISIVLNENFIKGTNISSILKNMSAIGVAALGMTFVLILGMIDLSIGAVMALSGCIACIIAKDPALVIPAIFAGVLSGGIVGLLNGSIITAFGIPAFIMTLATQNIARGIALLVTNKVPVSGMAKSFKLLGQGQVFGGLAISVIIMIALLLVCWILLMRTRFGRYVFAAGGNPSASKATGVNVAFTVLMSFFINGLLVGLAGVMLMSRLNSGQPLGADGYEFSALTAVVLGGTSLMGGTGSMTGTFIGVLIVAILDSIMMLEGVNSYWQYIIKGTVIALAVIADFKTKSILSRS